MHHPPKKHMYCIMNIMIYVKQSETKKDHDESEKTHTHIYDLYMHHPSKKGQGFLKINFYEGNVDIHFAKCGIIRLTCWDDEHKLYRGDCSRPITVPKGWVRWRPLSNQMESFRTVIGLGQNPKYIYVLN